MNFTNSPIFLKMKKILGWLIIIILIPICYLLITNMGTIDVSEYSNLNQFEEQKKARNTGVSFAIINTGIATTSEAFVVKGGSLFSSFTISHSAIFIKHPKGNILFDTGLGSKIDEQFEAEMPSKYKLLMKYEKFDNALTQLEQNGYSEDSIAMVIPSHLHWDHASGIEDFIHTEILISNSEKEWAFQKLPEDEFIGCLKSQYDDDAIKWKPFSYTYDRYENFDKSYDIYNDGSIVLLPIPGHTPGSVALLLTTNSRERYLFSGDLTWSLKGLTLPADKFSISSEIVDNNLSKLHESIVRVYYLKKRYPNLHLIPAHDYAVHKTLGFFPKFIK